MNSSLFIVILVLFVLSVLYYLLTEERKQKDYTAPITPSEAGLIGDLSVTLIPKGEVSTTLHLPAAREPIEKNMALSVVQNLREKYGRNLTFNRTETTVRACIHLEDGTKICATGPNQIEAVNMLALRVAKYDGGV